MVFTLGFIVALFAVGIVLAAYYVLRSEPQSPKPRQFHQKIPKAGSPPQSTVSRELQSRLLNMVAGDRATAHRLVDNARASNPGCPESWYWEKAIDDLIRDRR